MMLWICNMVIQNICIGMMAKTTAHIFVVEIFEKVKSGAPGSTRSTQLFLHFDFLSIFCLFQSYTILQYWAAIKYYYIEVTNKYFDDDYVSYIFIIINIGTDLLLNSKGLWLKFLIYKS